MSLGREERTKGIGMKKIGLFYFLHLAFYSTTVAVLNLKKYCADEDKAKLLRSVADPKKLFFLRFPIFAVKLECLLHIEKSHLQ